MQFDCCLDLEMPVMLQDTAWTFSYCKLLLLQVHWYQSNVGVMICELCTRTASSMSQMLTTLNRKAKPMTRGLGGRKFFLPLIMKDPTVKYSPVGAVLET